MIIKNNYNKLVIFLVISLLSLASLTFIPTVAAIYPDDCPSGLVSYWRLDETSAGAVVDCFGSNDGTNNGASIGVSGMVGTAYSFDGINDYIEIPDDDSLSFGDGSGDSPFSISAWVYMRNTVVKQRFVAKIDDMNDVDGEYLLTTDGLSRFGFFLADPNEASAYAFIGKRCSTTPSTDRWYHLVGTYDGSGDPFLGIKLYVDGVSCGDITDNRPYDAMDNTPKPLGIGKYGINYLDGMMDEVAIFNVELTDDDVTDLYCRGLNGLGFCDTLVYTGGPQSSDSVTLEATLSDSLGIGLSGYEVSFNFNGVTYDPVTTDSNGVASITIGDYPVGVYEVYAFIDCYQSEPSLLPIYDPTAGFVTGGGWVYSIPGSYLPNPSLEGKAIFGFVSKYKKGKIIPTGNTEFQFKAGDLNFHSSNYEWLVIAGSKAMFKGEGTINGAGNYGFKLYAIDEKLTPSTNDDLFRIKIWDKNNNDAIIYDNQPGDENSDPTTILGGGQIVIHKK